MSDNCLMQLVIRSFNYYVCKSGDEATSSMLAVLFDFFSLLQDEERRQAVSYSFMYTCTMCACLRSNNEYYASLCMVS